MSAYINTLLIVGGTSGLGEQFARRFHALGKKVIITGRRSERLAALKNELGDRLETYQWDLLDLANLTANATEILKQYPNIDAVHINSGIMNSYSFLDSSTSTEKAIIDEINTNLIAPALLTRAFVPHLAEKAKAGSHGTYMITGSGLGFLGNGLYPTYNPTKAGVHAMTIALRQHINQSKDENIKKNLNAIEIVAPWVDTDLDSNFRATTDLGDRKPMPLQEYMDVTMEQLSKLDENGKPVKETCTGFSEIGVSLWRNSIGKTMNDFGMIC